MNLTHIRNYRHGYRKNNGLNDPTYTAWRHMNGRCLNPRNAKFPGYGGRGITICEEWRGKSGFANFLRAMGEKPKGLTLGRRDNNGNYEATNCRWETQAQQAHNRRSSRLSAAQAIAIMASKGATGPVVAKAFNVSTASIYKIWDRSNWSSITTPRRPHDDSH